MRGLWKLALAGGVLIIAGCAGQQPAPEEPVETAEQVQPLEAEAQAEPGPLEAERIAYFTTGSGEELGSGSSVSLTTGGSETGRLVPASSNPEVTLYMTRDGSVPSAENNWAGEIDPAAPPLVTRRTEGTGTYKLVAELNGAYSDVTTVYVTWTHESDPVLAAPVFEVDGREVSGSVEIPVSDGSTADGRLYIRSSYISATLYINRDGTDPTPDAFWRSQTADGTYLYSPEPTQASYRVIAVWQGASSPVAKLDVTWVE
jgi:hypothetical protein